jgi:hypothetical protein
VSFDYFRFDMFVAGVFMFDMFVLGMFVFRVFSVLVHEVLGIA